MPLPDRTDVVVITPLPADPMILAAAALAGSDRALGHALTRHEPAAYRVALRLLGREADAQDAVQEGFLNAVRAIRGGGAAPNDPARFEPWLLRVVANAALTRLRRRTRPGLRVSVDAVADALPASDVAGPSRAAERRETRSSVLRAIMVLSRSQREALTLREYHGLSYDEIGKALGVSHSAAEMLVFRARRSFRAAYEGLGDVAGPPGCVRLAPLFSRMLDDEVSTPTWHALTSHLEVCDHCRREVKALRRTRELPALLPA